MPPLNKSVGIGLPKKPLFNSKLARIFFKKIIEDFKQKHRSKTENPHKEKPQISHSVEDIKTSCQIRTLLSFLVHVSYIYQCLFLTHFRTLWKKKETMEALAGSSITLVAKANKPLSPSKYLMGRSDICILGSRNSNVRVHHTSRLRQKALQLVASSQTEVLIHTNPTLLLGDAHRRNWLQTFNPKQN